MSPPKKKNNLILRLLVDYTVYISICKVIKQAEILQEASALFLSPEKLLPDSNV